MRHHILRVLVVALLAPTLVLLSGPGANAAVKYGASGNAEFSFRDWHGGVGCSMVAYYMKHDGGPETGGAVRFRINCDWNMNMFGATTGSSVVTFSGAAGCSYSDTAVALGEEGKGSGTAGQGGIGPGLQMCPATEVCMSLVVVRNNGYDSSFVKQCRPINLGEIPSGEASGSGCEYGTVTRPVVRNYMPTWAYAGWQTEVKSSVEMKGTAPTGTAGPTWYQYVVMKQVGPRAMSGHPAQHVWVQPAGQPMAGQELQWRRKNTAHTAGVTHNFVDDFTVADWHGQPPETEVIGVGVILTKNGDPQFNTPGATDVLTGKNDPSSCAFYWGTKITANYDPAGDFLVQVDGEPPVEDPDAGGGGSTEEPDEEPPAPTEPANCDFSLDDPSTWLNGGMCAVVGAVMEVVKILGKIVTALDDLVALIGSLLGDLLTMLFGLFIPDNLGAIISTEIDKINDAFWDTSAGKWMSAFTAQGFDPPGGSCGGIPADFTLPGGVGVDMNIGAACSGATASAAAVVKLALTVGLVVFGGLACIRAVGSGFGWNPGIGKGADT